MFKTTYLYVFRFCEKPKSLNRDTCIFTIKFANKKANLGIKMDAKTDREEGMKKNDKRSGYDWL
jgi:hypothetical protein